MENCVRLPTPPFLTWWLIDFDMEISVYQLHLESDRFQFMLRKDHKFQKRSTHLIYRVVLSRKQQTLLTLHFV